MRYELRIQDPRSASTTYLFDTVVDELKLDETTTWKGVFAFVTARGVDLLLQEDAVREFCQRGTVRLVVGVDAITDPAALVRLKRAEHEFPDFEVRVFRGAGGGLFHPKITSFDKNDGTSVVVVGSGNLTVGGLRDNVEAYSVSWLTDTETAAVTANWEAFVEERADDLSPITEEILAESARNILIRSTARRAPLPRPEVEEALEEIVADEADLVPAATPEDSALVAEIPRGGARWAQGSFNQAVIRDYFGVEPGSDTHIFFRSFQDGRFVTEPPRRCIFPVGSNRNVRIELGAGHGADYPENGRPIAVFRETGARQHNYVLLMPEDEGYDEVLRVLEDNPSVGKGDMRRVITSFAEVQRSWRNCPL